MNYKELIGRMRCPDTVSKCDLLKRYNNSCVECSERALHEAADAIETLLAEREAAVAELERIADFTESEFLGYLNDTIHHECGYEYYCQLFDLLSQVTHWEYDDKWQAQKKGGGT